MDRALHPSLPKQKLPRGANHGQEAEDIRHLDARKIAFKNGLLRHGTRRSLADRRSLVGNYDAPTSDSRPAARKHRGTTSRRTATTRSISSGEVIRLSDTRTVLLASASDNPIALRTWLGSTRPEEQAEPVETATPCRSSPMTIPSASAP